MSSESPENDDVGEVEQPEHAVDRVDRESNIGTVLAVCRRRKQVHQIDCATIQLP
jgi:hypothetical protein